MIKKQGFTLIETIVVVALVGFLLPAVFSVIFSIMREQAKIFAFREVKRQGDIVLNNMEVDIKNNATSIHNGTPSATDPSVNVICNTTSTPSGTVTGLYFRQADGNYFHYYLDNTVTPTAIILDGNSTTVNLSQLTTNKVSVTNFSLSCTRTSDYSPPIVSIAFTVNYVGIDSRPENTASLQYQTKIKLTNY